MQDDLFADEDYLDPIANLKKENGLDEIGDTGSIHVNKEKETSYEEMPIYNFAFAHETFLTKLPNFISVEPSPFDPINYQPEQIQDEFLDDEGRVRLKLKIENTIRNRIVKNEDGKTIRESNTRLVEWSDGSFSLHIGSEIFDVINVPLPNRQNHLFVKQGGALVCKGFLNKKLTFKPHSTKSNTHKRVTISVADRLSRAQKICILPTGYIDPEKQKMERIRIEDEAQKQASKESAKAKSAREKASRSENLDTLYENELKELEKRLDISESSEEDASDSSNDSETKILTNRRSSKKVVENDSNSE